MPLQRKSEGAFSCSTASPQVQCGFPDSTLLSPYAFGTRAIALFSIFLLRWTLRKLTEFSITFTLAYGVVKVSIQT